MYLTLKQVTWNTDDYRCDKTQLAFITIKIIDRRTEENNWTIIISSNNNITFQYTKKMDSLAYNLYDARKEALRLVKEKAIDIIRQIFDIEELEGE